MDEWLFNKNNMFVCLFFKQWATLAHFAVDSHSQQLKPLQFYFAPVQSN